MTRKKTIIATLIGMTVIFLFAFTNPNNKYFYIAKNLDIFATLFSELNTYYIDPVAPKPLIERGIKGMLGWLDPYGEYIAMENAKDFNTQTTGQYAGIGALIGSVNGKVVIMDLYKKFPAERAGLKIGDEIISIDGENAQKKSIFDISSNLQGKLHTKVKLLIKRQGREKNTQVLLARENIKLNDIAYQGLVQDSVGYIKLEEFRSESGRAVEKAVITLKQKGAKKLILDLRDNRGGLLYEAINVVNVFLPKGLEVVSIKGRVDRWNKSYKALNNPVDVNLPIAILVNEGSASASEIVAGALQDYDRAILVGRQTFGKGLVQTARPLSHNAQLKITAAKYYIPSGRCIQVIDYRHREEGETVDQLADSLKTEHLTQGGRKVYEGKGITPDIKIAQGQPLAPFTMGLVTSGQLFDYATTFCAIHPPPATLEKLEFSDADYAAFVAWLKNKKIILPSRLNQQMQHVVQVAKDKHIYHDLSEQFLALEKATETNRMIGLVKFKDKIIYKLKQEIAFHYGLVDNAIEMTLTTDAEIAETIRVLNDSAAYNRILTPL